MAQSRRGNLSRTISFQHEDENEDSSSEKKGSPSFLSRIKNFKEERGTLKRKKEEETSASPTPMDDIIFLESFEESHYNEELNVIVCKDLIRQSLFDLMKPNVQILHDIESEKVNEINIEEFLRTATKLEKNVAFLWSVFYKKKNLLDYFLKANVDVNFCEPQQGFSALHLSAFNNCINCTEFLLRNGANVRLKNVNYSPLHCAAFGNSPNTAKILLKSGADKTESVLITAVRANASECVQFFIENGFDVNVASENGLTALHVAADLGYENCLLMILNSERADVNIQTTERKDSALHLAAENGFVNCVKHLIDKGANPNLKNSRQQTALHLASKTCIECVEILLKAGGDPNSHDSDNRTPLHSAVCKSEMEFGLEITQCLISWRANINEKDKYGYTPLHIAALNELNDCVECLILNGGDISARTRGGTSALSIISRKTPSALAALSLKLDDCISMNDPDASSKEVILKFNFRYLLQNCNCGEISFLQTFVDDGQKNLLEHPICEAFLYLKWQKIRKYYIARLVFCLIYVLILSLYVLTALAYQCYNDSQNEVESRIILVDPDLCATKSYVGDLLRRNPFIIEMEWFILLIMTFLEIFRKIYGFSGYKSFRHYVTQLDNLVEWFVVASVFLVSFIYTGRTYIWQNHVGALAVLCGWANLMIMIGHLPIFGSYVTMYVKIQKEFTKLFMAYICLLIGFTVCFCVIFPKAKQFTNPFVALVKILVMMTGELEFDDLLDIITQEESATLILLEISALTTFVLFLLFVTIILMNLLIGIAVHDIQGLKKTAVLSKLVGQTKLIAQIESALFNGCLPGYLLKLLQITALISPSAYRVVVCVKPLNPRECRLPKNVMRAALEIAKLKSRKNVPSMKSSMRRPCKNVKKNTQEISDTHLILIKLERLLSRTEKLESDNELLKNENERLRSENDRLKKYR